MKQNEYKFDKGYIKYRYPKIFEAMRLISKMGISPSGETGELNEFEMAANILESLEPYLLEVDLDGKKLEWDDVVTEYSLIPHLQNVGMDIVTSISQQDKKRKARKK